MTKAIGFLKGTALLCISLTFVVGLHEYVHLFWGQYFGARVASFSIGFGPEVIGYTAEDGVRWRISALPIGGYVSWVDEFQLRSLPTYQTLIILLSAPLANIFVVAIAFAIVQLKGNVSSGSPLSEKRGILYGFHWLAEEAYIVAKREEEIPRGFLTPIGFGKMILQIQKSYGLKGFLYGTLLLSGPIGVFNLLPIPPLDGGQAVLFTLHSFMSWENVLFTHKLIAGTMFFGGLVMMLWSFASLYLFKRKMKTKK